MDSYEEILQKMTEKYEELSGATLSIESDIMLRLKVLSAQLYSDKVAMEFIKRQMFVSSASDTYLDKHAHQRGLYRKEAVKASGEVTFSLQQVTDVDIIIDEGTVVSTSGVDVKNFETTQPVILRAGTLSVKAPVVACVAGADHNVVADSVTVMVTPPLHVTAVTNENALKGGVDKESDEELRKRVLYSYQDISNGSNAVYYKRLAESVPGIYSASVVPGVRGAGTINVYVCGKGADAIDSSHIQAVQELIDENRELNVDVLVLYAVERPVYFTFYMEVADGYDFADTCEIVKAKLTDYIESLGVGEPALKSDLGDIIYHTQGVTNYSFVDSSCIDVYPGEKKYCTVEEIYIRAVA